MADWREEFIDEEEERKKRKKNREAEEQEKRDKAKEAKKIREEAAGKDWKKMSPGGAVRTVLYGDKVLAGKHIGEAMNQLFILKNGMKLGNLLSMSAPPYILADGTIIRVQSIYGQDQVVIDSPSRLVMAEEVGGIESCTVSLINPPGIIQPMRNPGKTLPGEVAGTDFIKSYYNFDVSKCNSCVNILWNFDFKYKKPVETKHYHNQLTNADEPFNH
jgi:hypothetical protein